jgi:hypothetical protein
MLKKSATIIASIFLVIALSACNNVPTLPQPASTTQPVATSAASSSVSSSATSPAKQPTPLSPQREQALKYLDEALKGTGWMGGTVVNVNGNSIELRSVQNASTINVLSSAIVVVPNKPNATVADIQRGDRLIVDTVSDTDRTVQLVLDFPGSYKSENLMMAVVQAAKGNTLTMRDRTSARQTNATASTVVVNMTGDAPNLGSLADLKTGAVVLAMGASNGDAFDAQVLILLDKDIRNVLQPNAPAPSPTPTKKP